jgi:hypothetical protein
VFACGFCHLPNGLGRPENSSLAGLPASYIVQQVADFKSGARKACQEEAGEHQGQDWPVFIGGGSIHEGPHFLSIKQVRCRACQAAVRRSMPHFAISRPKKKGAVR